MTQSVSGLVSQNTEVTFICVTDEAEPTANVVWKVGGEPISFTGESSEQGMYNTQKRRSVLSVTMDRSLNSQTLDCYVTTDTGVRDEVKLDVMCEQNIFSLLLYILDLKTCKSNCVCFRYMIAICQQCTSNHLLYFNKICGAYNNYNFYSQCHCCYSESVSSGSDI